MAKKTKTSDQGSDEHEGFLPIANVGRIMKKSIPSNGKISKEAKETVKECVSEFISFITGEASDKCQREKRKTVNGDDLLWAMTTLGFDGYVDPLKIFLSKYLDHDHDHDHEHDEDRRNKAKQDHPKEQLNSNIILNYDYPTNSTVGGSIRINYEAFNADPNHGYEDNLVNVPFGLGQIDDHDDDD